jgi:hypothetical protein
MDTPMPGPEPRTYVVREGFMFSVRLVRREVWREKRRRILEMKERQECPFFIFCFCKDRRTTRVFPGIISPFFGWLGVLGIDLRVIERTLEFRGSDSLM